MKKTIEPYEECPKFRAVEIMKAICVNCKKEKEVKNWICGECHKKEHKQLKKLKKEAGKS